MVDTYAPVSGDRKGQGSMGAATPERFAEVMLNAHQLTKEYQDRRAILVTTSTFAANLIENNTLDFVFIDSYHDYESVKRDITLWYPKVRQEGIISGHDYDGRGDRVGRFGVKKAVDEIFYKSTVNELPGNVWWTHA
jgi:hypothetical protein